MRKNQRQTKALKLEELIQNESPNNQYIVNEIVLVTIPGYSPWPARILNIVNETISVEFFGTGQM